MTYKIIRHYLRSYKKRTVDYGLTREEAEAHCSDPETSSETCKKPYNKRRTQQLGPWFDSFTEM